MTGKRQQIKETKVAKRNLKVVVGLGKTGLSCIRHLVAKGHRVAVTDNRLEPPGLMEVSSKYKHVDVRTGKFDEDLLNQASEIILSPGVSLKEPSIVKQIKRNIPVIGDIELFARETTQPVVAITGSNGKSTVTSLVGHFANQAGLKVKVGGNLGTPALDLLDDSNPELYVLELSSFQLETTFNLKCLSAVNLNITPDHMDRYDSLQDYINAKLRIYNHCQKPIINLDDPQSYLSFHFKINPRGFTLREPRDGEFGIRTVSGNTFLAFGREDLLATKYLRLRGQHQYANSLAALAIGYAMGLPLDSMTKALMSFEGLPHRCQWITKYQGIDWYNDSKATNVGSCLAAITGIGPEISGKLILLAGGQGKKADFSDLYNPIAKYVRTLILYGEDKHLMAKDLEGAAPILFADDLQTAAILAKQSAHEGDVIILSPACASYDMFRNFEHRGEAFMKIVRGLTD